MQADSSKAPNGDGTIDESLDAPLAAGALDDAEDDNTLFRWLAALVIGLIVVAAIVAFFTVKVCEQQLSNKGTAVKICRHLQGSDPPAIAVGIVLLAMLSVFFTEISGFGVTLKREVARLKRSQKVAHAELVRSNEAIQDTSEQPSRPLSLGKNSSECGKSPEVRTEPHLRKRALPEIRSESWQTNTTRFD